jgi:hypothetical protein
MPVTQPAIDVQTTGFSRPAFSTSESHTEGHTHSQVLRMPPKTSSAWSFGRRPLTVIWRVCTAAELMWRPSWPTRI